MAGFIAGKFPTGDYFLKNGSITIDQLDIAIAEQKKMEDRGQHELIGKILIKLGYITQESVRTLFKLKADSKKRFVLDPEIYPTGEVSNSDIKELEAQINELKKENKALKQVISKIGETVKRYDN